MVSPPEVQGSDTPQIGSVGFVISTRSLCVYTPIGWTDVQVPLLTSAFSLHITEICACTQVHKLQHSGVPLHRVLRVLKCPIVVLTISMWK